MYLLGYDIGSSSIKASLIDIESGKSIAEAFHPEKEMEIHAHQSGWAEQPSTVWWENLKTVTHKLLQNIDGKAVKAIGISYQMHGLVCIDKNQNPLRSAIIWCDSRAVPYGQKAFQTIGEKHCLNNLLNSPGNFTAAKLAWIKENEPHLFNSIHKIMLPGDYIAMMLTGEEATTPSGLSEGIFWDFKKEKLSEDIMNYFGFSPDIIPRIRPTFSTQGEIRSTVANELGLTPGIPVTYRAGDQPNNALSLNVLNPGEVAATGGTSGVVYGINQQVNYDPQSRVNSFLHVNHTTENPRLGVLLCINGTGILNSWVKKNIAPQGVSYGELNEIAATIPIGAKNLSILPFGNGAERILENETPGCLIDGLNFNIHNKSHIIRAAQEGIVFSFKYGMDIMAGMGIDSKIIRAGYTNMFLSPIFRETLAGITGSVIELYNTNGAEGAARGAGIGAGIYSSSAEAFRSLKKIAVTEPNKNNEDKYISAYTKWEKCLTRTLNM